MAGLGLGKLFHVIHMGETLKPLDDWYDDFYAPRRGMMDGGYSDLEKRDASLIVIADAIIEPMAPSSTVEGWQAMPVGRFWQKFGSHWHSLAFYCDDTGPIWERLRERNVRMVTDGGNPITGRPTGEPSATSYGSLFTHPKDTGTQLEFYPKVMAADPRYAADWDPRWSARHPLGIDRLAYATLVVRDLDAITALYVEGLGGTLLHQGTSELTGTTNAYVLLGTDTIVELATPDAGAGLATGLAAAEASAFGDMLHAVAWRVTSLDAAQEYLAAKGVPVIGRDEHTILADPRHTFGGPLRFTTWDVPGDPRA